MLRLSKSSKFYASLLPTFLWDSNSKFQICAPGVRYFASYLLSVCSSTGLNTSTRESLLLCRGTHELKEVFTNIYFITSTLMISPKPSNDFSQKLYFRS
ncbi:unnamed protein product [Lactuca virosa]|uniref:Uncharacterized protein n=1 Tax=Lactuca virosa TaxID=75947 RepID=A0AAU9M238_9ASTR|nr:unnamed protein product [Lactuca virosa]